MAKTVQQYLSMPNVNTNCWQHWQKRGIILRCKKSQSGHFQAQCIHLHIYLVLNQLQHTPHTTHTRLTALFSGTTQVNRYQKGKTNLDFTEARDSEWQWHQLGHYASLHLAADRQPCHHPTTQFFTGRMLFLQHWRQNDWYCTLP